LAKPPGDRLSAISLSHEAHKGDAGIHSIGSAELLAKLADAPSNAALIVARRKTNTELQQAGYVSVNPQVAGWRAFLADVSMRVNDPKYATPSSKPREDKEAGVHIFEKAKEQFEEAEPLDSQFIEDNFVTFINETISSAPEYAYEAGKAVVAQAMEKTKEGSESGRTRALEDLRASYEIGWEPFRKNINV
jgi:hypothetical protein